MSGTWAGMIESSRVGVDVTADVTRSDLRVGASTQTINK